MYVVAHIQTRGLLSTYEKRLNPALTERPVVILQNNKVADYCLRAKAAGIITGTRKKHASYNLPDGVFLKYRKDDYQELLTEISAIMANFSPQAEIYKGQDFFLDLTGEKNIMKILGEIAKLLLNGYCDNLVVSIAKSKLTARACSLAVTYLPDKLWRRYIHLEKLHQKVTFSIVNPDERAFWSGMPVQLLWPLDIKTIEQLQFLGLNTCKQVQETSTNELARHFGNQAGLIYRYSCGVDYSRIQYIKNPSLLIRFCLLHNSTDQVQWEKAVHNAAQGLAADLAQRMEGFQSLQVVVTGESGLSRTETRKTNRPLFTPSAIKTNVGFLLNLMKPTEPVHSIKISLGDLCLLPTAQIEMFSEKPGQEPRANKTREKKLAEVINSLNRKYPSRLISFGATLTLSRREQMLQLWDPLRFAKKEVTLHG